jgi:hypothetical protein
MSHRKLLVTLITLLLLSVAISSPTQAQTDESVADLKRKASELLKQTKYTEALPSRTTAKLSFSSPLPYSARPQTQKTTRLGKRFACAREMRL